MSWTNEANTFYRITSCTALGATINGIISAVLERIVQRNEPRMTGPNNGPGANPPSLLSSKATLVYAAIDSFIDYTTAVGNVVVNFSEAGGGSGSVTIGPMRASGIVNRFSRGNYDCVEQEFDQEALTTTYNVSA